MIYYTIAFILISIIAYAWLNQPVKKAVVEPVGQDGLIRIKLLSVKSRGVVFWENWKGVVMFWVGLVLGGWLGWML